MFTAMLACNFDGRCNVYIFHLEIDSCLYNVSLFINLITL